MCPTNISLKFESMAEYILRYDFTKPIRSSYPYKWPSQCLHFPSPVKTKYFKVGCEILQYLILQYLLSLTFYLGPFGVSEPINEF